MGMDVYPHPPTTRMIGRGLRRRCPLCGAGGLFRAWVKPLPSCPRCQLKLDRGEGDFFLGSYTLNFVAVQLLLVGFLLGSVMATWPAVPWRTLLWVGAALVVLAPIAFYPSSRTVWLAIDLTMRPPTPRDFPARDGEEPGGRVS
jgi:uncharacterized protein (DUF983 family)